MGCEGDFCTVFESCAPFQPGDEVLVWGTIQAYQNVTSMVMEGFCFK